MNITDPNNLPNPVGESKPRLDVLEKVTGSAIYTDDIQFGPGLLHARVKRSPYPHAKILSIDYSKAEALPGVKVVVTGEDFPKRFGLYLVDKHIFARDKVLFIGQPVAAVAAISEDIAEKAIDLIDVEYEELEAVFDPVTGALPDAPLLHPDMAEYEVPNYIFPQEGTNIANHFKVRKGDVEGAFKESAYVVESEFYIPHVQHVPIEPHVAVAKFEDDGTVTLWAASQSPFAQRNIIASSLGISQSDMRVIAPFVGGGFGCKAGVTMEALPVAIASKVKGKPVKLVLTREEEFYTNFVRQALVIKLKMGCDAEGNLTALHNTMYWDGGASTEYGVNITRAGGYNSTGPYFFPNVHTDSLCVYTNHPIGGAYRGFGMSELHTGIEQTIDMLAEKISMDAVDFRLQNCVKGGDIILTGMTMHPTGLSECIEKAAKAIEWDQEAKPSSPNKFRGKGIALMWKAPSMPPNAGSSAECKFNEDGTVTVSLGGQEIGQGTFTVMAQMAAGILGIPYENVRVRGPLDTRYSPYEWQTVASRLTWSMGNAVVAAAQDARQQLLDVAADHWDEDPEDLDIVNGHIISYKSENDMSVKNVGVYGLPNENDEGWKGGPIVGRGNFMPTYVTNLDFETGQGERAVVHYTVGAQAFDIEIDKETGRIEVLNSASAFDVGKAINPELVKAQIEGGFIQGYSSAVFEQMLLEEGAMKNPNFVDYRIATSVDIPNKHHIDIIEVPQDDGPWGARGIGEHPMVPTIAALGNAIYNATGLRLEGPPFTAEKLYLAMLEAGLVD